MKELLGLITGTKNNLTLLPNKSFDVLSANADSQSFNMGLALLWSDDNRDSKIKCLL